MKKSVFEQVVALVNGRNVDDMDALREEINAEWNKINKSKSYDEVRPIVFSVMSVDTPLTVKEIFGLVSDKLPEDFNVHRVQYGLLNYWADYVVKHDNGKSAKTYTLKV